MALSILQRGDLIRAWNDTLPVPVVCVASGEAKIPHSFPGSVLNEANGQVSLDLYPGANSEMEGRMWGCWVQMVGDGRVDRQ